MNQRTYKIRSFSNGKNRRGQPFTNYSLTIPSHIAEKLPREMQFYCELSADGLLFRPVPPEQEQVVLPPWAQAEEETKPKRTARKRPTKASSKTRKRPTRKQSEPEPEPEPPEAGEIDPDYAAELQDAAA